MERQGEEGKGIRGGLWGGGFYEDFYGVPDEHFGGEGEFAGEVFDLLGEGAGEGEGDAFFVFGPEEEGSQGFYAELGYDLRVAVFGL